jgi:hypothetical protein
MWYLAVTSNRAAGPKETAMLGFDRAPLYTTTKVVNGQMMTALTAPCVFTGEQFTTEYYPTTAITAGFRAREDGALIQDAFPFMSVDDREFVQSGISPKGWDRTFAGR